MIGARSRETQATQARRAGNGVLNRLASYLAGRDIPDLTSEAIVTTTINAAQVEIVEKIFFIYFLRGGALRMASSAF